MKSNLTIKRVIINAALIIAVIVAIAVAAHFLLRTATRHGVRREVPTFTGISLGEARLLAKNNDLDIYINDSLYVTTKPGGTVLDQLPAAGVKVKPGRTIYVVINAFGKRMVEVPYVAGRSLRQAKNMLDVAGLEIKKISYVEDMATNYVLSQSYNGKAVISGSTLEAPVGSGIELTVGVSEAHPTTLIPNVIGLSLKEAKSRIWESGLNVGKITADKGIDLEENTTAKVYIQASLANTESPWGAPLSLTLTLDQGKINSAVAEAREAELEYEKALAEGRLTGEEEEGEEESEDDLTIDFFE